MRYTVSLQFYSLDVGRVGEPLPYNGPLSQHRSLNAACRVLSSAIAARRRSQVSQRVKLARELVSAEHGPCAERLVIRDNKCGIELTLRDAHNQIMGY